MSKRLLILCAIAFVVAVALPAFAAVQNVKVSGDLAFTGVSRRDFDLKLATESAADAGVINTIARVKVDADLTDNVSTCVRLINERDWDADSASNTDIDLDLAYVTLREMLYSPLTVTVGRQELRFGIGFIVGDVDTNNRSALSSGAAANADLSARKAFDAIRATLDYNPLVVDLIYSKIDANTKVGTFTAGDKDDIDLAGLNARYNFEDEYGTVGELYVFYKNDRSVTQGDTDYVTCPGLRVSSNPIKKLNLSLEGAWQFGNENAAATMKRKREANACQMIGTYAFETDYNPVAQFIYSYFSGDKNPLHVNTIGTKQDKYRGWDPMFEDQSSGHILNALFDATNSHVFDFNLSAEPIEDLTLKMDVVQAWLAQSPGEGTNSNVLALRAPGGNTNNVLIDRDKNYIGMEIDGQLSYDYTEDVQLNLLYGWFNPGTAFVDVDSAANEIIGSCKVVF